MYSKNDYRYYLEKQLVHSEDFLAHYGVKGMKWHKKKEGYTDDRYNHEVTVNGKDTFTTYGQLQKKQDMRADRKQLHQHVNETNPYKIDRNKSIGSNVKSNIRVAKDRKQLKAIADKKVERYYNHKSSEKKSRIANIRKKYGLYRSKPKGKKLSGGGNIYVSHD